MKSRIPASLTAFVALTYLGLLAPLVVVIAVSFDPTPRFDFPPTGLSLRWYVKFAESPAFIRAFFQVSLLVGLLAAAAAVVLGSLAAIGIARFRFPGRTALETFFLAPLFVPQILLAVALYLGYLRLNVSVSMWTLLLSHIVICTPYVIRTVLAGLAGIDGRLEEAAVSLGATRAQAFVRVVVPLLKSSFLSGGIFAFIISFSDINLSLFLSGPSATTLPLHIFSLIQYDSDPTIAAASTLQIVVVGALIWVIQRFFRLRLMV